MEAQAVRRLQYKSAREAIVARMAEDLRLAPFLAQAYFDQVSEYFAQYAGETLESNQVAYCAVAADEPPGKPLAETRRVALNLTLHAPEDLEILRQDGLAPMRRQRILRICQEAHDQGALLTHEDLEIILTTSRSTIKRDIKQLREQEDFVPTRGQQRDIGPAVSHKLQIVKRYLRGDSLTQISQQMRHGIGSMERYLQTFRQVAIMTREGLAAPVIQKGARLSASLMAEYQALFRQADDDPKMQDRLADLLGPKRGGAHLMPRPNERHRQAHRLSKKTLHSQLCYRFLNEYGFSNGAKIVLPIVDDILDLVAAHYGPDRRPTEIIYTAAHKDATHTRGKTIQDTELQTVRLTMVAEGDCEQYALGSEHLCSSRLVRWLTEAFAQDALLTTADLAYLCGHSTSFVERLIRRHERATGKLAPLRGTVHDCSGKLTHKRQIVALYVAGNLPTEIARMTDHSLEAVERYLRDFELVRELSKSYDVDEISRMLQRGARVVKQYLALLEEGSQEEGDTPLREPSVSPGPAPTSPPETP